MTAFAHANIAIPGSLTQTVHLEVGDTYEGVVTVTNATNEVQRVDVRILDRQPAPQRRFVEPGNVEASAAPFLVPEATEFVLAPQERRQFRYQVVVPEAFQGDIGSYWTTLMFEPLGQIGDVGDTQGAAIVSKMRIAYGVIVHLGDPPTGTIEIRDVRRIGGEGADDPAPEESEADTAPLVLGATFSVSGSKIVEAAVQARMFDQRSGEMVLETPPRSKRLYPGYPVEVPFDVGLLPAGLYELLLLAETEDDDLHAIRLDLEIGSGAAD